MSVKELVPEYRHNPVSLFRLWLECGKDFKSVQITLRRGREKLSESSAGKKGVKAKDLDYDDQKKPFVIDYLTKRGLYMDDEMFPGDPTERWYFPTNDINLKVAARSWESVEGTATGEVSGTENLEATFGETGFLAPPTSNALPVLAGGTFGGVVQLPVLPGALPGALARLGITTHLVLPLCQL